MATLTDTTTQTQCRKIREWLASGKALTSMQALDLFGVARLASRIWDLGQAGFATVRRMILVRNREGKEVRVAEYRMAPAGQPAASQ